MRGAWRTSLPPMERSGQVAVFGPEKAASQSHPPLHSRRFPSAASPRTAESGKPGEVTLRLLEEGFSSLSTFTASWAGPLEVAPGIPALPLPGRAGAQGPGLTAPGVGGRVCSRLPRPPPPPPAPVAPAQRQPRIASPKVRGR